MTAKERILELLEAQFNGSEFFIVDVKQSANRYQVFIDSDKKLSIAKCAEISRFIEGHLEEENLVPEKYILEVSSPGMTNPLKHIRQYQKRIGSELNIYTVENKHVRGILKAVNGNNIVIDIPIREKKKIVGHEETHLTIEEIKKAVVVFSFKKMK